MKVSQTNYDKTIEDLLTINNNIYDIIHCLSPSCNNIPSIQMDLSGQVSIQCSCSLKETKKLAIGDLLKEINSPFQSTSNDICEYKLHNSMDIKAEFFCIQCKCFLCKECKDEHNKIEPLKMHTLTCWKMDYQCNKHGHNQFKCKKYKHYCGICNEHLCKECKKSNMHFAHNKDLISLNHLIENNDVKNKDKLLQELCNQLTIVEKIKKNIITFINDIKNRIEKAFSTFSHYYTLCKMIHNTFLLCPKNYFSISNIINNNDIVTQLYNESRVNDIKEMINNQTFTVNEIEKFISVISLNSMSISLSLNEFQHKEQETSPENFGLYSTIKEKHLTKTSFFLPTIKKLTPSLNYEKTNIHNNITITSIILLEDKRICTSSIEKFIEVFTFTLNTSNCDISKENAHDGMIYSLCQMQNSKLVSSSYMDIKIWTINQNDLLLQLHIDTFKGEGFFKVIELPELKLAGCTMNKQIKIWNLKTLNAKSKEPELCLNGHKSSIKSILYNINTNHLISSSATLDDDIGSIIKWNLRNMNNIIKTEIENVNCSSWNSLIEIQENVFAIGGTDSIVIVDFEREQIRSVLDGPEDNKFQGRDDIILIQYGTYSNEKGSFIAQTKGMICLYEYNEMQNNWVNVFCTESELENDINGNGLVMFDFGNEFDGLDTERNSMNYLISSSLKGLKFWKIETTL